MGSIVLSESGSEGVHSFGGSCDRAFSIQHRLWIHYQVLAPRKPSLEQFPSVIWALDLMHLPQVRLSGSPRIP